MRLRDPSRPKNERGMPRLVWEGKPVAIVPHLMFYPAVEDTWHIMACVCYRFGVSRYYGERVINPFFTITAWEEDTEALLQLWGWKWEAARPALRVVPKADLDLDVSDILDGLR